MREEQEFRFDAEISGRTNPKDDGPLSWQVDALCTQSDPEAFFPDQGNSVRAAKKICSMCIVKSDCLDYALQNDEKFGIWGGLTEFERRRLKRRATN